MQLLRSNAVVSGLLAAVLLALVIKWMVSSAVVGGMLIRERSHIFRSNHDARIEASLGRFAPAFRLLTRFTPGEAFVGIAFSPEGPSGHDFARVARVLLPREIQPITEKLDADRSADAMAAIRARNKSCYVVLVDSVLDPESLVDFEMVAVDLDVSLWKLRRQ